MLTLNDKQRAEFYFLSYTRVDGLWFMKVEEKYGFDEALNIDSEVWKVMPKIQARLLKSFCKADSGAAALLECLSTKLTLDTHSYRIENIGANGSFRVIIEQCPWHHLMVNSGREHLAAKVGSRICQIEYSTWAAEFGDNIHFQMKEQLCNGSQRCVFEFAVR